MEVERKPAKATKFKGTKDTKATRGASPGAVPRALASARIVGLASRTLRQCRQFYVTYPGMWQALSAKSQGGRFKKNAMTAGDNSPVAANLKEPGYGG